jgi:DNA primase
MGRKFTKERGITEEDINLYRIGYYPVDNRLLFPMILKTGGIPFVQGRLLDWDKSSSAPKYYNYPQGAMKSKYVYGEHLIKKNTVRLVTVEGPIDSITLNRIFRANGMFPETVAVSLFVSSPSIQQASRIVQLCEEVILCGDNDSSGQMMDKTLAKFLDGLLPVYSVRYEPNAHDPDSVGEGIVRMINERKLRFAEDLERMFMV